MWVWVYCFWLGGLGGFRLVLGLFGFAWFLDVAIVAWGFGSLRLAWGSSGVGSSDLGLFRGLWFYW